MFRHRRPSTAIGRDKPFLRRLGGSRFHLVQLELRAGLLAVGRVLLDHALLHGLVEAAHEILELLLGLVLLAGVRRLEELLVRGVQTGLDRDVALVGLRVLTVAFAGGTAAFDVRHCDLLLLVRKQLRVYCSETHAECE